MFDLHQLIGGDLQNFSLCFLNDPTRGNSLQSEIDTNYSFCFPAGSNVVRCDVQMQTNECKSPKSGSKVIRSCKQSFWATYSPVNMKVKALAVSSNGTFVACGLHSDTIPDVYVWHTQCDSLCFQLSEHKSSIRCVAFSPDEKVLVTLSVDGYFAIWDMSNGGIIIHKQISMNESEHAMTCAVGGFIEDAKRKPTTEYHFVIATNRRIYPFGADCQSASLRALEMHSTNSPRHVTSILYSIYGDVLFIGSESGDVQVFGVATAPSGKYSFVETIPCGKGAIRSIWIDVRCSPNPTVLRNQTMASHQYQYARFGKEVSRSTTLYVASLMGEVYGFEIPNHDVSIQLRKISGSAANGALLVHQSGIVSMVGLTDLHASKIYFLLCTGEGSILLHEYDPLANSKNMPLDLGIAQSPLLTIPGSSVLSLAVHPTTSNLFATCSLDGALRQWFINDGISYLDGVHKSNLKQGMVTSLAYVPNVDLILAGCTNGDVRCLNANDETLSILWEKRQSHKNEVVRICLAQEVRKYVTGSKAGEVRLWDIKTRQMLVEWGEHRQEVTSIHPFVSSADAFLTSSKDRSMNVLDARVGRRVKTWTHQTGGVNCIAYDHTINEHEFHSVGMDHRIYRWDVRMNDPIINALYTAETPRLRPRVNDVPHATTVMYCRDTIRDTKYNVIIGGSDGNVQWLDPAHLNIEFNPSIAHSGLVTALGVVNGSAFVLSGSMDSCICIWRKKPS